MTGDTSDPWKYNEVLLFDGARKALARTSERAEVWDLEQRRRTAGRPLGVHQDMAVADGEGNFVLGGQDGAVRLYDSALKPGTTLGRMARTAGSLAMSADGAQVAVASYGGEFTLFTTGARRGLANPPRQHRPPARRDSVRQPVRERVGHGVRAQREQSGTSACRA
ncbi:WD40 repeat domain-containing protein [Streptomyces luteolus]|uniref:Anaphase-promoting complex subunit 4 WD40 domain-containing protein n=1 Tax=Streptomyces luteolus TaxID=3043615 RepID=A0ABT6T6U9_9ACTN|nr:hypothetical protein [Streptomyces sp. B-S-A12]MDI3423607.1 hypothetical protein [Streptomyces sp. B-S-A12]